MSAERRRFLEALAGHARAFPDRVALDDGQAQLSYGELLPEVRRRRERLAALGAQRIGLALDNGLDWALWDLALLSDERVAVPVPGFFSSTQRKHLVASAGLDSWLGDADEAATLVAPLGIRHHLALLSLSTLLENIGGLYVPLWLGATRLAPALLTHAEQAGWPVFEGYGLSECASVVSLNRPGEAAHGVGRPLPHATVRLSDSGEVEIKGATMLGYLGEPPIGAWHSSGDLGRFEGDHLHLDGRRREIFITAYGRNVDPQWVEAELTLQPMIAQALVHGEALDHNRALIVPRDPLADDDTLTAAISAANTRLPDYARVHAWRRATPFTPANDQLTANGRLRRATLLNIYHDWLTAQVTPTSPAFSTSSTGAA
ncbi:AMP-binding protein [Halomonas salinarum]|uniref:AMP-binding protein n=1 Tax=Halomonas salinarum TaxID=1158993 RepID=UPI00143AA075|nr:AMP-binding protein [Halomonas salinarum]